jgi:Flp pilus assembly protein TadG
VKLSNRRKIDIGSERGQSLTEFALALPILALLLFAVIQFGITFNNYVTLTDATRAGARQGAVARRLPNPVSATTTAVVNSACGKPNPPCNLKGFSASNVTVTSTWQPAADVKVTAIYPYEISLLGMVVKSGNLSSTTTERVE